MDIMISTRFKIVLDILFFVYVIVNLIFRLLINSKAEDPMPLKELLLWRLKVNIIPMLITLFINILQEIEIHSGYFAISFIWR